MAKKTCRETRSPAWQQVLLPDEVIEDILTRLPARSVARCRCLSRSWAAVLSSRGFINRHLDHAARALALALPTSRRRFFFFSREAAAAWSACLQEDHPYGQRITRSCRGLGLVKNCSTGLYYVCNPSTGQAASIPDGTPVKLDARGHEVGLGYASFGLGHDARADRHKVVRLYYHAVGLPSAGCEVYDVGVSSKGYWRPAASGAGAEPPRFALSHTAGVFAQGRVHWLATGRRPTLWSGFPREPDSVMSFSLADETFTSIPLPPSALTVARSLRLTVLQGGRLGLVSLYRHRPRHIWTPAAPPEEDHPPQQQLWSQLATVAGNSGYDCADDDLYEESLEPVGRPHEDVLFASTAHLHALSVALRRLPARTLGRLKSVCRGWRAVIESDRFASAHNEHHRRLAAASSSLADRVMFTITMTPPLVNSRVVVSKPCHGLAQVMMSRSRLCGDRTQLLNPVTRACRIFYMDNGDVDVDDRSLEDVSSSGGGGSSSSSIGLGYDESRQEHVLVLLAADRECKVWRLREGLVVARTAVPAPPITPRFLPPSSTVPPVYMDGRIHWMCCSPRAILSFCVRAGAFRVVPPPPPGPGTGTEFLVELRRLLCVVQSCPSTETITIWSSAGGRDDDGAWSREYVIELGRWPEFSPKTVELVVPMAIEPRDGRILLDTGSWVGYYDPARRTLQTVVGSLHGPDHPKKEKKFFAAALWEESLVRPYGRCLTLCHSY